MSTVVTQYGSSGWIVAAFVVMVWWIRGMADRKRASTEEVVAGHGVSMEVIGFLKAEVQRLNDRVAALERANITKDTTISDLNADKLALTAENAALKLSHGAELAAESLLKMAALAEVALLRSTLGEGVWGASK